MFIFVATEGTVAMVSRQVPQFILEKHSAGKFSGRLNCSSLFVDISGFSTLTEKLSRHGQQGNEILAGVIRSYFDPLLNTVETMGGFVANFAGDAFTVLFPENKSHDTAMRAYSAAYAMLQFVSQHSCFLTPFGAVDIGIKIGLAVGTVKWMIIRLASDRLTYCFWGQGIDGCASAEHRAERGTIALDDTISRLLTPDQAGPIVLRYHDKNVSPGRLSRVKYGQSHEFLSSSLEKVPMEGEFRNVAVAFISFCDVEDLNGFAGLVYSLCKNLKGLFTNIIFGDKGGNIPIFFGAPSSYENDEIRAVDFCLDLIRQGQQFGQIRAGVASGIHWAGFHGGSRRYVYTCLGNGVNLAARLMMAAPWSHILSEAGLYMRLSNHYQWENTGTFNFKGFSLPVETYRAISKKLFFIQPPSWTVIIGRDREMEDLAEWTENHLHSQSRAVAFISGEAGIGKSFLISAYRKRIIQKYYKASFLWLEGQCEQLSRLSWKPFLSIMYNYFRQDARLSESTKRAYFNEGLNAMLSKLKAEDQFLKDEIERLRSVFAALLGIFDNDSMYASLEPKMKHINSEQALILFFNVLNRFKPLIIYIEDVQWIDQDSMEIIRKLCVSRKNGCFLILMCARSEGSFKSDDIRLPEVKDIHRINLSYFNRDQLSQLVKTLLEQPASDEFLDYLLEKTSGNPFYSEQLVRHLNELNLIGKSYGKVCHFLSDVALPRDVNTLLIARLDRLISEVKETIQIASVLGRQFYLNILSALLQQREIPPDTIDKATRHGIWLILDDLQYLFHHALLRDAAYQMQAKARLRVLHKLAAGILEDFPQQMAEEYHSSLGYHWEQAGDRSRARFHYINAARNAAKRFDLEEAENLYRAYLRLSEEADQERVHALNELGYDVYFFGGRLHDALDCYSQARDISEKIGYYNGLAKAMYHYGMITFETGNTEKCLRYLDKALDISIRIHNRILQGNILSGMAYVHSTIQDIELPRIMELYEQSLAIHTAEGDELNQAMTLCNMGGILTYKVNNLELARQYAGDSIKLFTRLGNKRYISHNLLTLGVLEKNLGRIPEAESYYQQALSISQDIGDRLGEAHLLSTLGNLYRVQGQLEKGIHILEKAVSLNRELENANMVEHTLRFLSTSYLHNGNIDKCGKVLKELREIAYSKNEKSAIFSIHNRLAEFMRLTHPDCTEAEKNLAQAERYFSPAINLSSQYNYYIEKIKIKLCGGLIDHEAFSRINEMFQQYGLKSQQEYKQETDRITKAVQYASEGKNHLLYRGELWEYIPEELKNWITANIKP